MMSPIPSFGLGGFGSSAARVLFSRPFEAQPMETSPEIENNRTMVETVAQKESEREKKKERVDYVARLNEMMSAMRQELLDAGRDDMTDEDIREVCIAQIDMELEEEEKKRKKHIWAHREKEKEGEESEEDMDHESMEGGRDEDTVMDHQDLENDVFHNPEGVLDGQAAGGGGEGEGGGNEEDEVLEELARRAQPGVEVRQEDDLESTITVPEASKVDPDSPEKQDELERTSEVLSLETRTAEELSPRMTRRQKRNKDGSSSSSSKSPASHRHRSVTPIPFTGISKEKEKKERGASKVRTPSSIKEAQEMLKEASFSGRGARGGGARGGHGGGGRGQKK